MIFPKIPLESFDKNTQRKIKGLSENLDLNKLLFEGLEVRNESKQNLKVRLILVRATGRFFLYIHDEDKVSFKEQEIERNEGFRVVQGAHNFESVPIQEAEY